MVGGMVFRYGVFRSERVGMPLWFAKRYGFDNGLLPYLCTAAGVGFAARQWDWGWGAAAFTLGYFVMWAVVKAWDWIADVARQWVTSFTPFTKPNADEKGDNKE